MTPGTVFTLSPRGCPGAGDAAADLTAIRRTDAILDLLAARRLQRPQGVHDPAVSLLRALSADVDAGGDGAAAAFGSPGARAARALARRGAAGSQAAQGAAWVRTAAAAAVVGTVVGVATTTGIAVTSILMRLARQAGLPPPTRPGRP